MDTSCCEVKLEMSSSIKAYIKVLEPYGITEEILPFIIVSVVILVTAVIWKLANSSKSKNSGILLVGVSNAGKTVLFNQLLLKDSAKETLTSIKENKAEYSIDENTARTLTLLDLPGHESIRQQYLDKFKGTARGVIFVVDSETFQKNIKDVAEFLFQMFTDRLFNKVAPRVCIACNKQDLLKAKSKQVIEVQLEKELNTVRKTQSAALSTISGGSDSIFLGQKGEDFKFKQLHKFKVEFVECNVNKNEEGERNLDEIKSWIASLI